MRKQKGFLSVLSLFILCQYLTISFIATFGHNHEPDANFHDNCPACQWEIQKNSDDNCTKTILNLLLDPLFFNENTPIFKSIILVISKKISGEKFKG